MASYLDVFRRLRVEMNGAVSQSMRENGLQYGANYGVSLPTIKSVAADYYPDHDLAAQLWRQEIRELQLAAIYIEDPAEITAQQMEAWSADFHTTEVATVVAMELFHRAEGALSVAAQWFESGNDLQRLAACHMIGKSAKRFTSDELRPFITNKATAYALREIFKVHLDLRPEIEEIKDQVEDLVWQLEEL